MSKTIHIAGTLDCLEPVADFVASAAAKAGLSKERGYRLRLAVDEIVTNIVLHGYEENGLQGDIQLLSEITNSALTITVEDSAPEFDPMTLNAPDTLEAPLEERPIGGLGIFLVLKSVDAFRYQRTDGRNFNVFVMNTDASC